MVWPIFHDRIGGLLLKYCMIIFISGILYCFRNISGFIRIFLKSSDFNGLTHISSQNWWFTSQIWYDNLLFYLSVIFSGFLIFSRFFQIFSGFSLNLQISMVWPIFFHRIGGLFVKYDMIIQFRKFILIRDNFWIFFISLNSFSFDYTIVYFSNMIR